MTRSAEFLGRDFGDGHLVEDKTGEDNFGALLQTEDWQALAEILGWSEGCPVVPKVIDRGGAQAAAETYAELLLTRQIQLDIIRGYSASLADLIASPANRRPDEPPGEFIESSVPSTMLTSSATQLGSLATIYRASRGSLLEVEEQDHRIECYWHSTYSKEHY